MALLYLEDLRIVGCDDDDIVERDGPFCAIAVDPACIRL
jgi:hypothetical protein